MADKPLLPIHVALTGRLITGDDATIISPAGEANFQSLKNMRYTDTTPKSISGMTKINTTALPTYPKIRSGIHFKKDVPSESHMLVRGFNGGETESKVFKNDTAIPNQGDFNATALHTDATGSGKGIFSEALSGNVAYCNGRESLIWGGDEHFSSGFVNYDPDGDSFSRDYTTPVQSTRTDSANIATLKKVASTLPSNTGLLLHLDNNVTDSSTTVHTVTNNNVTFTTDSKFGSHAGVFNGTNANLTIPDHADFDFSGGDFSIDFWFKPLGNNGTIFSQATDANNYIKLRYDIIVGGLTLDVVAGGATVVQLTTFAGNVPFLDNGNKHHIEVSESGSNWYLLVDGVLVKYLSDASRAADYTGEIYIGSFYDGATASDFMQMELDEFRIGKTPLHTNFYDTREVPYGTAAAYVSIGAVMPIKGAKFYIETANTTASSSNVLYWEKTVSTSTLIDTPVHGQWLEATNIVDGTASGGNTLAQDGIISFTDTESLASIRILNGLELYWYKFVFTDVDDTTTISRCTLDMSMQGIKDLWDGEVRQPLYFEINDGTTPKDNTVNVFEPTYDSSNTATFADASSLPNAGYLMAGFAERITALDIRLVTDKGNTAASRPLNPQFWDGDSWTNAFLTRDRTYDNNAPLAKSGVVAWNSPEADNETKQEIEGRLPLYYYRVRSEAALSAGTQIYFVGGIPTPREIDGYKFPISSHNRLMLGSNQDNEKNSVLIGANGTNSVFNGDDSIKLTFGNDEEIVAGLGLYSLFSSSLYNLTVLCKLNETWLLEGNSPSNYTWYRGSESIGCVAPYTMKSVNVEPTQARSGFSDVTGRNTTGAESGSPGYNGAIWQGVNGIYLFNGRDFTPIHRDIDDVFERINVNKIADSVGFVDELNDEYHWLVATGASTTLNEEWVFDIRRFKWYQADRVTDLQSGFGVVDTLGNEYTYGTIDTGYVERLDNGTTFDGSDIVSVLHTGDATLDGNIMTETQLRKIKLVTVAKINTANEISIVWHGDGALTGSPLLDRDGNAITFSPLASGKRITKATKSVNTQGGHMFHSLKFSLTTDDETSGFEPLYLGVDFKEVRESIGE